MNAEESRLKESQDHTAPWRSWGPYVSERAWGTVREDYSATGEAWDYFPHDHARSRAYRWSEDGLAGIRRLSSAFMPFSAVLLFAMQYVLAIQRCGAADIPISGAISA